MVVLACFSPPSGIKGNVMEIENNSNFAEDCDEVA